MSRPRKHGEVELTGTGKIYYTNSRGETEPFDRDRFRASRPSTGKLFRDNRVMTL